MKNKILALSAFMFAGALMGSVSVATSASSATALVGANGMTLYLFDKDAGGVPSCYKDCATMWPPAIAKTGDKMGTGWTTVKRTDGTMQWAYDKHPLYFYSKDTNKGDKLGDGVGGVWHVAMGPVTSSPLAAPALAATQYYVSQDTRTHRCYVVAKIGAHGKQIGLTSYKTKALAKAALKSAPECTAKM